MYNAWNAIKPWYIYICDTIYFQIGQPYCCLYNQYRTTTKDSIHIYVCVLFPRDYKIVSIFICYRIDFRKMLINCHLLK